MWSHFQRCSCEESRSCWRLSVVPNTDASMHFLMHLRHLMHLAATEGLARRSPWATMRMEEDGRGPGGRLIAALLTAFLSSYRLVTLSSAPVLWVFPFPPLLVLITSS